MWAPGEAPGSYIGVVDDITSRKCAEEEVKHLQDELESRVEERTADRTPTSAMRRCPYVPYASRVGSQLLVSTGPSCPCPARHHTRMKRGSSFSG